MKQEWTDVVNELEPLKAQRDALIAERDALREALEPLGKWKTPETFEEWPDNAQVILTVKASHIRRARAALK